MRLRKNKLLSVIASVSIVGAAAAVAVSCSDGTRFDQNNDNKIKIAMGWDPESSQARALRFAVDMYNNTQKGTEDFMKVELDFIGFSYEDVMKKMEQQLISKDRSNLFNLVMTYISGLGIVAGYDMQLNLKKTPQDKDPWGIKGDELEEAFLNFNNNIGGLPKGGIYGLPLTKSTPVTSLNSPLFSYIIQTMVSFGAKIKPEDKDWFENLVKLGMQDRAFVVKEWGAPVESEKSRYENGKFVLSRDIFNNATDLIDFAGRIQQLFTNSRNNPTGYLHAFAIEDISNIISTQVFSMTAKKAYDFSNYYTKIGSNGYVNYDGYADKNSESYKALDKIAKKLIEVARTGAIFIGESSCCLGNFPAFQFRKHQIAISIGSSSNYSLNFYDSKTQTDTYRIHIDKNGNKSSKTIGDGSIYALSEQNPAETGVIGQVFSNGKKGKLLKSTNKNFSRGNLVLFDEETDEAVSKFSHEVFENNTTNATKGILIRGYSELDEIWVNQQSKLEAAGLRLLGKSGKMKDGKFVSAGNLYGLLITDQLKTNPVLSYEKFSSEATLQEHEFIGVNSPRKWEKSDKMSGTYVQGASMIALHSNPEEDRSTRKFIHWLTGKSENAYKFLDPTTRTYRYRAASNPKMYVDDEKLSIKLRPLKFISLTSPYVVPYKGVFTDGTKGATKLAQVALDEFRQAANPKNSDHWSLIDEPTDLTTSQFRTVFINAWKTPFLRILNGFSKDVTGTYEKDVKEFIDQNKSQFSY